MKIEPALPADPLIMIRIVDDKGIIAPSYMTIGQMLTRNNIDNSATIFVLPNETAIQAFEDQMVKDRSAVGRVNREAAEECQVTCMRCILTGVVSIVFYACCSNYLELTGGV